MAPTSTLLVLTCVIIGEWSVICIVIEKGRPVALLQKFVKDMKPETITVEVDKVQLFLAKTTDGDWLDDMDRAKAVPLDEHGPPQGFLPMKPLLWLNNVDYFGENCTPKEGQIHVLVVVPKRSANLLLEVGPVSSAEWLEEFHSKRIEIHSLPARLSLPDFIKQALPAKIRMPKPLLASWSNSPVSLSRQLQDKLFEGNDESPCYRLRSRVLSDFMLEPLRSGDT